MALSHLTVQKSKSNGLLIEATGASIPTASFSITATAEFWPRALPSVTITSCQLNENQAGVFAKENAVVQVTGCSFDSNEEGLGTEEIQPESALAKTGSRTIPGPEASIFSPPPPRSRAI